eukprot:gene995-2607_t
MSNFGFQQPSQHPPVPTFNLNPEYVCLARPCPRCTLNGGPRQATSTLNGPCTPTDNFKLVNLIPYGDDTVWVTNQRVIIKKERLPGLLCAVPYVQPEYSCIGVDLEAIDGIGLVRTPKYGFVPLVLSVIFFLLGMVAPALRSRHIHKSFWTVATEYDTFMHGRGRVAVPVTMTAIFFLFMVWLFVTR